VGDGVLVLHGKLELFMYKDFAASVLELICESHALQGCVCEQG
jgi:hypothetical protein